jgi:hypothetical protein
VYAREGHGRWTRNLPQEGHGSKQLRDEPTWDDTASLGVECEKSFHVQTTVGSEQPSTPPIIIDAVIKINFDSTISMNEPTFSIHSSPILKKQIRAVPLIHHKIYSQRIIPKQEAPSSQAPTYLSRMQ